MDSKITLNLNMALKHLELLVTFPENTVDEIRLQEHVNEFIANCTFATEPILSCETDLYWSYVECCMLAVKNVNQVLPPVSVASTQTSKAETTRETANNPAQELSVSAQSHVMAALQFVTCYGLYPNLEPGVGLPMQSRMRNAKTFVTPHSFRLQTDRTTSLHSVLICDRLLKLSDFYRTICVDLSSPLRGFLLERCYHDHVVVLLQLSFSPITITQQEVRPEFRREARRRLMEWRDTANVTMFLSLLLIIRSQATTSSSSNWVKRACDFLLRRHMAQNESQGLVHVLASVLEQGSEELTVDTTLSTHVKVLEALACLLATPRPGLLPPHEQETYERALCQQTWSLLTSEHPRFHEFSIILCHEIASKMPLAYDRHLKPQLWGPFESYLMLKEQSTPAPCLSHRMSWEECLCQVNLLTLLLSHARCAQKLLADVREIILLLFHLFVRRMHRVETDKRSLFELLLVCLNKASKIESQQMLATFCVPPNVHLHESNLFTPVIPLPDWERVKQLLPPEELAELDEENLLLHQAEAVLILLENLPSEVAKGITGGLFLELLQEYHRLTELLTSSSENMDTSQRLLQQLRVSTTATSSFSVSSSQRLLLCMAVLQGLMEKFGEDCFQERRHVVGLIQNMLQQALTRLHLVHSEEGGETRRDVDSIFNLNINHSNEPSPASSLVESVAFSLALLALQMSSELTSEDKTQLEKVCPLLEEISRFPSILGETANLATELRISIATRGVMPVSSSAVPESTTTTRIKCKLSSQDLKKSSALIEELPSPSSGPEFGEAPQKSCAGENGSGGEDWRAVLRDLGDPLVPVRGHALIVLSQMLERRHPDAVKNKEFILQTLTHEVHDSDSYLYLSAIRGLAAMSDVWPDDMLPVLLHLFATTANGDGPAGAANCRLANEEERVLLTMKLGEACMRTVRILNDMSPKFSQLLLNTFISCLTASHPMIRATALSNLAEVCKVLRYALGPHAHELLHGCYALLRCDDCAEVRKGAALLLRQVLEGCGAATMQTLGAELLRDTFRALKMAVAVEKDEAVLLQVRLALDAVDDMMRDALAAGKNRGLVKKISIFGDN